MWPSCASYACGPKAKSGIPERIDCRPHDAGIINVKRAESLGCKLADRLGLLLGIKFIRDPLVHVVHRTVVPVVAHEDFNVIYLPPILVQTLDFCLTKNLQMMHYF